MSIRRQLSVLLACLSLASLCAFAFVALRWASAHVANDATARASAAVQLSSQALAAEIQSSFQLLAWLAQSELFDHMDPNVFLPALDQQLARSDGRYEKFIVALPDGRFYNTAGGNPHKGGLRTVNDQRADAPFQRLTSRDYFQATVVNNSDAHAVNFVSKPMISYTTGARQVVFARTLLGAEQQVIGMLGAATEWQVIEEFVGQLQTQFFADFSWPVRLQITDRDGNYWYHWNPNKVVRRMTDAQGRPVVNAAGQVRSLISNIKEENIPELTALFSQPMAPGLQVTPFQPEADGDTYYLIHQQVPDSSYVLAVVVSQAELLAPVGELTQNYLLLLLSTLAAAVVTGSLLARRITQPIDNLTAAAAALGRGESLELERHQGSEEFDSLAQTFNTMQRQVNERTLALHTSESRFQYAMQGANDGLWDWDIRTDEVYYSPRWFAMLGRDAEDYPPSLATFHQLLHPNDRQRVDNATRSYLEGRTHRYHLHLRLQHADGHYVDILSRAFLVRDASNQPLRLVGTHVDISKQAAYEAKIRQLNAELEGRVRARTAELEAAKESALTALARAEEANAAKSRFLANMSHELRTPLNAINGFADRLLERLTGELAPRDLDALQTIARNGQNLLRMINDILDAQRIDSGEICLDIAPVPLPELFDQLARQHAEEISPGVHFSMACDPDVNRRTVQADPLRLRQILSNLLSNAFKFTRTGEVSLRAQWQARGDRPGMCIDVTDTGPGIPAALVPHLFSLFTLAEDPLVKTMAGTGLGLALSHLLAGLHGGTLTLDTEYTAGARFVLWLPQDN